MSFEQLAQNIETVKYDECVLRLLESGKETLKSMRAEFFARLREHEAVYLNVVDELSTYFEGYVANLQEIFETFGKSYLGKLPQVLEMSPVETYESLTEKMSQKVEEFLRLRGLKASATDNLTHLLGAATQSNVKSRDLLESSKKGIG